jgi:hypothetical protein
MKTAAHNAVATPSRPNRIFDAPVSPNNRARMSNGGTLLPGVDGRSAEGRRYRDLVCAFAAGLGGPDGLVEQDAALVRNAAAVTMKCESMQAAVVRGEHVDLEQMTRLANGLTRALNAIRARRKPKGSPTC